MFMVRILLVAALFPPIYLARKVWELDRIEREPVGMVRKLFLLGCLSVIPALILELLGGNIVKAVFIPGNVYSSDAGMLEISGKDLAIYNFFEYFFVVALVEEGVKYLFLRRNTWNSPEFNYRFDGVVYAAMVSLGFAAAENVEYVMMYGLSVALVRAVTSIPGHCIFGIFMGCYYGFEKYYERRGDRRAQASARVLSLLVPVLLHGIYDFSLSMGSPVMALLSFVFMILLDIAGLRRIRRFAAEAVPV